MENAPKHCFLVFGHTNDHAGRLSTIARDRLDKAVALFHDRGGQSLFILGGGTGPRFNTTDTPHAEYARQHLLSKGIPPDHIVPAFADTAHTFEEVRAFKEIMDQCQITHATCVSSDLHLPRIKAISRATFTGKSYSLSYIGVKHDISAEDHQAYAQSEAQKMERLSAAVKLAAIHSPSH